jgi:hypothetical protein
MHGRSGLAWMFVVAALVSGCGAFRQAGPADDLRGWSAAPLPIDARLATEALKSSVCRAGEDAGPVNIVLQDRRTAQSAAFLVAGQGWSGSCLITVANGNGSGGSRSAPLPALDGALAVDERSSGGVGSGTATLVGGRAADAVVAVQVVLPSGQVVTASVSGGHWLAWWPGDVQAVQIVALDANGGILQTLTDTTPGYQQK